MKQAIDNLKPVGLNTKTPFSSWGNQGRPVTSFSQHRFHVLDGMRGLAAILVMVYHYYLSEQLAPTPWAIAHLSGTYIAVDFFFILSGFVICHSYGEKLLGGMSPANFLACRIARLFPMMAFGLLVGLLAFYCFTVSGHSNYRQPLSLLLLNFNRHDIVTATIQNLFFIPFLHFKGGGPLFPADIPLWSIFFESLASVAFIGLIRTKRRTLVKICISSLVLLLITAFTAGILKGEYGLDLNIGPGTKSFFGGFPRVFYGFTCGMLLYQLRSMPLPVPLLNQMGSAWSLPTFILYTALVGMLLFPHSMKGLYSFIVIMALAPLLIIQGSNPKCENKAVLTISEFLGWLSYPIYCLHVPVLYGMRVVDEHVPFSTKYGVSCEAVAIVGTVFLAIVSAFLLDRLKVQRTLAGFLRRIFECRWWRRTRAEVALAQWPEAAQRADVEKHRG